MIYGLSLRLFELYKKRKSTEAYYEASYDEDRDGYNGSKNKHAEKAYDEKYLSFAEPSVEIIKKIIESQKKQINNMGVK